MAFGNIRNPGLVGLNQIEDFRNKAQQRELAGAEEERLRQQIEARNALAEMFGPGAADPAGLSGISNAQAQQGFADAQNRRVDLAGQAQQQETAQAESERQRVAAINVANAGLELLNRGQPPEQVQQFILQNAATFGANEEDLSAIEQGFGQDPVGTLEAVKMALDGGQQEEASQPGVTGQPVSIIDPQTGEPVLGQQFEDGSFEIIRDEAGNPITPGRFAQGLAEPGTRITIDPETGEATGEVIPNTPQEASVEDRKARTERTRQQIKAAKEEAEREKTQRVGRLAEEAAVTANVDELIKDVSERADSFTTGPVGGVIQFVPGTAAFDLAADVQTIRANAGFDRLQRMRDLSPTGGALGQVSEIENRLLQSAAAALDIPQSTTQFKRNIERLRQQRRAAFERTKEAFELDFGFPIEQAGPNLGINPENIIPPEFLDASKLPKQNAEDDSEDDDIERLLDQFAPVEDQ